MEQISQQYTETKIWQYMVLGLSLSPTSLRAKIGIYVEVQKNFEKKTYIQYTHYKILKFLFLAIQVQNMHGI